MLTHTVPKDNLIHMGREVLAIEIEGLQTVHAAVDEDFAQAVALLLACTGRVVITGIGKSGLVGHKLAATFSSTGTAAFFMHPVEAVHGDMGCLRDGDVVLALSNSGETSELLAILPTLTQMGLPIIALTGKKDSALGRAAQCVLNAHVPREACPYGLAPTASTTAALALGDALAVSLMRVKGFNDQDFLRVHPGGALGQQLRVAVHKVMRTNNVPSATEDVSQREALTLLDRGALGALIVLSANKTVVGILTDGDVRRAVCGDGLHLDAPVAQIMTQNPCCASIDDSVAGLLDVMESKAITVLPVVDTTHRLLGAVHMHDLLGNGAILFQESTRNN